MSSDFVKKALAIPRHPAIVRLVEKLQAQEVAAANDLVASEEDRNYRPSQQQFEAIIKQLQKRFNDRQNQINFAILTGQTPPYE